MHPVCETDIERERQLYQQHSYTPNSNGDGDSIVIHENIKVLPYTPTKNRSTMEKPKKNKTVTKTIGGKLQWIHWII